MKEEREKRKKNGEWRRMGFSYGEGEDEVTRGEERKMAFGLQGKEEGEEKKRKKKNEERWVT